MTKKKKKALAVDNRTAQKFLKLVQALKVYGISQDKILSQTWDFLGKRTLEDALHSGMKDQVFAALEKMRRQLQIRSENVFQEFYETNAWGSKESVSGSGSELKATEAIRTHLPSLLNEIKARTLLDAPCGDFNWQKEIVFNLDQYIGIDIVKNIVNRNKKLYGNDKRLFQCLDLRVDPLPKVDVIFCRDCLEHLSLEMDKKVIRNFKRSGSRYLVAGTYPLTKENADIVVGGWRSLNLQRPPFNFPVAKHLISEEDVDDKSLGLWKLNDISL